MDRFSKLVFSFYREEIEILKEIEPLHSCRMSKSWATIFIDCKDKKKFYEIDGIMDHLKQPFFLIGLCREIVLRARGLKDRRYVLYSLTNNGFSR